MDLQTNSCNFRKVHMFYTAFVSCDYIFFNSWTCWTDFLC